MSDKKITLHYEATRTGTVTVTIDELAGLVTLDEDDQAWLQSGKPYEMDGIEELTYPADGSPLHDLLRYRGRFGSTDATTFTVQRVEVSE